MFRSHTILALAATLTLTATALAIEALEQDPKFIAVTQRLQADFGLTLKLATSDDASFAKNYKVTALTPEHLNNSLHRTLCYRLGWESPPPARMRWRIKSAAEVGL